MAVKQPQSAAKERLQQEVLEEQFLRFRWQRGYLYLERSLDFLEGRLQRFHCPSVLVALSFRELSADDKEVCWFKSRCLINRSANHKFCKRPNRHSRPGATV